MKKEISIVRDAIILIKQLPESDLKHEAILSLNLLLGNTIAKSDWFLDTLKNEFDKALYL